MIRSTATALITLMALVSTTASSTPVTQIEQEQGASLTLLAQCITLEAQCTTSTEVVDVGYRLDILSDSAAETTRIDVYDTGWVTKFVGSVEIPYAEPNYSDPLKKDPVLAAYYRTEDLSFYYYVHSREKGMIASEPGHLRFLRVGDLELKSLQIYCYSAK